MVKEISCQAIIRCNEKLIYHLKTNEKIKQVEKIQIGEIIKLGRYKGKLSNEDILTISGEIEEIINFISTEVLVKNEDKKIDLNVCILVKYSNECNFELSYHQISSLIKLNIPIAITCVDV